MGVEPLPFKTNLIVLKNIMQSNKIEKFLHVSALGIENALESKYAKSKLDGEKKVLNNFLDVNKLFTSKNVLTFKKVLTSNLFLTSKKLLSSNLYLT